MYGNQIGTLYVHGSTDNWATETQLWVKVGQQQTGANYSWKQTGVIEVSSSFFYLRVVHQPSGPRGDLAIDDFMVVPFPSPAPTPEPTPERRAI